MKKYTSSEAAFLEGFESAAFRFEVKAYLSFVRGGPA